MGDEYPGIDTAISERYGILFRGKYACEIVLDGGQVAVFDNYRSRLANWSIAVVWARAQQAASGPDQEGGRDGLCLHLLRKGIHHEQGHPLPGRHLQVPVAVGRLVLHLRPLRRPLHLREDGRHGRWLTWAN